MCCFAIDTKTDLSAPFFSLVIIPCGHIRYIKVLDTLIISDSPQNSQAEVKVAAIIEGRTKRYESFAWLILDELEPHCLECHYIFSE